MIGESGMANPARDRRVEALAAAWQSAIIGITYIPFPMDEVRSRFRRLASDVWDAIVAIEPLDAISNRGRAVGRELVRLNLLKPEALERTLACLGQELADITEPGRLGYLLAGIAGGFTGAAEASLLAQQEGIGRAATDALRRAQGELEASRDSLAGTNRELSEQIVERIRLEEIQRDYAERLQRLHQIDLAILSAESLPAIADISIDYIQHLIPALTVSIGLIDVSTRQLIVLRSNSEAYPTGRVLPITLADALMGLKDGRVSYVPDLQELRERSPAVAELANLGGRSMLAVPLIYQGELIGVLAIVLPGVRPFSTTEANVARQIANSVAVAIQNRRLLEAEQVAREREATLREVAASLTQGLDLNEVLTRLLTQLDRVIASRSTTVMLLDDGILSVAEQRGNLSTPEQIEELLAAKPGSIWSVLESGQARIIDDTRDSSDWYLTPGREYIRSWLGVPLLVKGDCIGILTIDRDRPNAFTEQDVALATAFANQAAIAIENVRLFQWQQKHAEELEERVRSRTHELEVLYGITAAAVEKPDLESLLRRSLELSADVFDCSAGSVHLIEGEEGGLQLKALHRRRESELDELLRQLTINDPILLRPLRLGSPSIISDASVAANQLGERAFVLACAPLRSRGQSLGVLSLLSETPDRFVGTALPLLTTIADQIGAAVENIRLRQITRQSAIIEERERLGREMHDSMTQALYSVGLFAGAARTAARAGNLKKVEQHMGTILSMTDQAFRELRLLLFELRTETLARLGLVGALRERIRIVERRAGIRADVRARGVKNLSIAIEETFYRIALEALNNALHYARAGQITVTLVVKGGELVMTIADDGVGFDQEATTGEGGMGLEGMQKRIGKVDGVLTLSSNRGGGTKVVARAPLGSPDTIHTG